MVFRFAAPPILLRCFSLILPNLTTIIAVLLVWGGSYQAMLSLSCAAERDQVHAPPSQGGFHPYSTFTKLTATPPSAALYKLLIHALADVCRCVGQNRLALQ